MVVVHRKVDVVTVFLQSFVVHLFVGNVPDYRRFVIHVEVETETVSDVGVRTAVAVVKQAFHFEFVLTVVDKAQLIGTYLQKVKVGNGAASQRVRLVGVVVDVTVHHFARYLVGNSEGHGFGVAQ